MSQMGGLKSTSSRMAVLSLAQIINDSLHKTSVCTAGIAKVPFDSTAAANTDITQGMPISFDFTSLSLGVIQAGAQLPNYSTQINQLTLVGAANLGSYVTGAGDPLGAGVTVQKWNVTLGMVPQLFINNQLGQGVAPITVGSFVIGLDSGGNILTCLQSVSNPEVICSNQGMVYAPLGFNGVQPDANGCVPASAYQGPAGAPGAPGGGTVTVLPAPGPAPKSDIRVKRDIAPFSYGLNEILKIRPVWFRYNGLAATTAGELHAGVVAQELAEVAPRLVEARSEKLRPGDHEPTAVLRVRYNDFDMMLIRAIQEQQREIETLKKHINAF
jgi:hypothetical protein